MATSSYIRPAARGHADVTGQAIAGASAWTQVIALGSSDFDRAQIEIGIPNTVLTVNQRRLCGQVWVTRDTSDAYAQSPYFHHFSVQGYPSGITYSTIVPRMRFYSDADDGVLSEGYYGSGAAKVRLDTAAIVGSNIELVWRNEHGSATAYVTNRVEWDAYMVSA